MEQTTEANLNHLLAPGSAVIVAEPQPPQKKRGRKPKPKPDPSKTFKIVHGIVIVNFTD